MGVVDFKSFDGAEQYTGWLVGEPRSAKLIIGYFPVQVPQRNKRVSVMSYRYIPSTCAGSP